jgi:serine/threonine protein kinase
MLANTIETYGPPRHLGRYELIAPLGEGGMARVYLAVQRGPVANKLVVIKLLREQFTGDEHFVAMFADESRIAVLLNHPNVIHTYESSSTESAYYIVMEFLEGKTLSQLLRRVGRENFPLEVHLWVLCEILSGLHYAHQLSDFGGEPLNIVHRDVSPSNIQLTVRGEVKLLDFGIAKVQGAIAETQHGIIKGKLGYASPEQCLGTKADGRADVYSVGVMLWEALAGKRRPLNETALATAHATAETDIAETLPGVPLALARIVRRALARDPAERFRTALAFELELRQYLVDISASNGAPALRALVTKHFEGELAAIRRAIDEQVGSVRHSLVPDSRSPGSGRAAHPLGSEAPHNVGVTAPPGLRSNRLRQLVPAVLLGIVGLAGASWFIRTSSETPNAAQDNKATTLGAALPAEAAAAPQQFGAQARATNSEPSPEQESAHAQPGSAAGQGSMPKRRPLRIDRPTALTALKPVSAPPLPLKTPTKDVALASPPPPEKGTASAEPGIDLRKSPTKSTVRSLDERDPYAP